MARYVWLIFLGLGIGCVLAAPINLLGKAPDPPSPETTTGLTLSEISARIPGMPVFVGSISRQLGNFLLTTGVLLIAIAGGPFRKGERWAWYTLWIVPVMLVIQFVNSRFGRGWQFDLGLVPVTVAGLLATRRQFLSGKPQ